MAHEPSKDTHEEHEHSGQKCDHDHDHTEHGGHGDDHDGCNHENSDSRAVTVSLAVSGVLVGVGLLLHWLQLGPALLATGAITTGAIMRTAIAAPSR